MGKPIILAPRHHKILSLITKRQPSRLTTSEIFTHVGGNISLLYRDLRFLVATDYLSKERTGRVNEHVYGLGSKRQKVSEEVIPTSVADSQLLLAWLQNFAEKDTYTIRPQSFGWRLPWATAKLYGLASYSLSTGGKIKQTDLDSIKAGVLELHDALVAMLATIKALLDSDKVWNPDTALPLLLGDAPADLVVLLSKAINEKWSEPK